MNGEIKQSAKELLSQKDEAAISTGDRFACAIILAAAKAVESGDEAFISKVLEEL